MDHQDGTQAHFYDGVAEVDFKTTPLWINDQYISNTLPEFFKVRREMNRYEKKNILGSAQYGYSQLLYNERLRTA